MTIILITATVIGFIIMGISILIGVFETGFYLLGLLSESISSWKRFFHYAWLYKKNKYEFSKWLKTKNETDLI